MTKTIYQILYPLSCRYKERYGRRPFDLSTWDASEEFVRKMSPFLRVKPFPDMVNYYYSWMLPVEKKALLHRLEFDDRQTDCVITTNGTSSLALFVNWLSHNNFKRLHVVTPFYFAVEECCKSRGIEVVYLQIEALRNSNHYRNEVILFTNPYYSLGTSTSKDDIDILQQIIEHNWVVADECLANQGDEISRILGNHPHFMGIYTPHKSLVLNGLKFSLLVFPQEFELFFAQSVDYLCGSINLSALCGINHYLSDNYDQYYQQFQKTIYQTHLFVKELLSHYPKAQYQGDGTYYFATISFPGIDASISRDEQWIWEMVDKSGALFIPGYYNNDPDDMGFCFRINLTQDSPMFRISLCKLMDLLQQYEIEFALRR